MTWKQCKTCAGWLSKYPEEIALTLYPPEMATCPRCSDVESELVESNAVPRYKGAPEAVKPEPQRMMFV